MSKHWLNSTRKDLRTPGSVVHLVWTPGSIVHLVWTPSSITHLVWTPSSTVHLVWTPVYTRPKSGTETYQYMTIHF